MPSFTATNLTPTYMNQMQLIIYFHHYCRKNNCIKAMKIKKIWQVVQISVSSLSEAQLIRVLGAQWLSGRVLDLRPRGHGFEPPGVTALWSLSKTHLS